MNDIVQESRVQRGTGEHSFFIRRDGKTGGKRTLTAACPCGWVRSTTYGMFRKYSTSRSLRYSWMTHA